MFFLLLLSFCIIFINTKTNNNKHKNLKIGIPNDIQNDNKNDNLIEIANYTLINQQNDKYFYIPIFGTSDIHGHFYPEDMYVKGNEYSQGGLDYLAKYISIIREEFNNQILYLDAGDLFQGGTESSMSEGEIIMDYFNLVGLNAATFGNHEFDYPRSFIEKKLKNAKFKFLSANIFDKEKKTKKAFGDNHFEYYIFNFNVPNEKVEIKIGVIGLAYNMTKGEIYGDGFDNIRFDEYKEELEKNAKILREENGVNAVVLLSHIGIICGKENNLTLNMYKPTDEQETCGSGLGADLFDLIQKLKKGTIDAIVTGHSHREAHHFVNDIPIISPVNNGIYANIIYLAFDKNNNYQLAKDQIRIEGPLPICAKIFQKNKRCEYVRESEFDDCYPLTEYTFHGVKIEKDSILQPIHDKYDNEYKNYNEKICTIVGTEDELRTYLNGSYYLGNIITDIQKFITGADISILSYGILRSSWNPGKIPLFKIKDLLPFANDICTYRMKGSLVKRMMKILQTGNKKYYMTSGIKQIMAKGDNEEYFLADMKLFDGYKESEINSDDEYTVAFNSYFAEGGDDFAKIVRWDEFKGLEYSCDYGIDSDITETFLRAQQTIDIRKYMDEENQRIRFIE